ncbi:MAG TPA: pilin [Usitatibacter sp.]|nr:pilin [Usitatibacter sp.]
MRAPRLSRLQKTIGLAVAAVVVLFGLYWYLWAREMNTYKVRSKVTEIAMVAGLCKTAVAEYYAARRRMPANAADAGCGPATSNVTAPRVVQGEVSASAQGELARMLADEGSGTSITYKPVCGGACSEGAPATWECKSATDIDPRFRPSSCR